MAVKVEVIGKTDCGCFVILETSADGLPKKRTSVHIDSIADGRTTLEEQIELAREDGELRLRRIQAMNEALGDKSIRKV
jgi:hypothetical protein